MPDSHDERGGDEAAVCSTPCNPDCDAVCHGDHVEGHKKQHWPYDCPAADKYFDEYFRGADGFVVEVIKRLRGERDDARELARASLDILRNVSDEPMRELFEVDDMGEMPAWFTGYGKPSDAKGADAAPDGRSGPVERSETSGGAFQVNTSSILPQGLSEPEPPRDTSAWCWAPSPHTLLHCGLLRDHKPPHRRGERTWIDDTTEDGRHG